jgi:hypothetical protein
MLTVSPVIRIPDTRSVLAILVKPLELQGPLRVNEEPRPAGKAWQQAIRGTHNRKSGMCRRRDSNPHGCGHTVSKERTAALSCSLVTGPAPRSPLGP